MKKSFLVIALAMVLVFALATSATAKFAGADINGASDTPGYFSWAKAIAQMDAVYQNPTMNENIPFPIDIYKAHGGYGTSTTKCAVCHSVHRAITVDEPVGGIGLTNISGALTGNDGACLNCHGAVGSVATEKPIEWPDTLAPGPGSSAHSGTGCPRCHSGRIHGGQGSKYYGMNAYMLGNERDTDTTIAAELAAGNISAKGFTDWFAAEKGTAEYNSQRSAATAWGVGKAADGTDLTPAQMAGGKSNAASYTCGRTGCHVNSMFAVNVWGFGAQRFTKGNAPLPTATTTGHRTTPGTAGGTAADNTGVNCGPCHPGNPAGGYRDLVDGNILTVVAKATSYGCDQCHDMVGAKTGTTAWPHANGRIKVAEWAFNEVTNAYDDADLDIDALGRNLWMYQGNAAEAAGGEILDSQFTVVKNATQAQGGITRDGVCLKCHVPVDDTSLMAMGNNSIPAPADDWYLNGAGKVAVRAGMHNSASGSVLPIIEGGSSGTVFGREPAGAAAAALIFTYK